MSILNDFRNRKAQQDQSWPPSLDDVKAASSSIVIDTANLFPEREGYPPGEFIDSATPSEDDWQSAYEYVSDSTNVDDFDTLAQARDLFIRDVVSYAHVDAAQRDYPLWREQEDARIEKEAKERDKNWWQSVLDGSNDQFLQELIEHSGRRERFGIQAALNRNAIIRELVKMGGEAEHISGQASVYIRMPSGTLIRVSDHELPSTPEREYNRSRGLTGEWDLDLTDFSSSPEESVKMAIETLKEHEEDAQEQ